jgi:hypothetical protein
MPWPNMKAFQKSITYKRLKSHYGGEVPPGVARQFMSVVNSQIHKGLPEGRAIASAYAAVKRGKK